MRLLHKTGPMESLRKWFYKPKRDDRSLLAQFFFADDALNMIAAELDSFDGRKDPDRCSTLVNQLRHAQDRVLNITSQIMDQVLGDERVARGFRVKFPEDVLQDNLAGQLWFGAECLAAGSSIMNREEESAAMRPLAKALTRSLETVRGLLREQCLRPRGMALSQHDDMLHESLRIFDRLFAEFELCYVSAMVSVKSVHEFEAQQLICVLFSESLRRALRHGLLTQEQVDSYDPALMFAVPRLAIVSGLLIYSSGPLSIDRPTEEMSDMFRPFRTLLHKIRSLLYTLERRELLALERLLCSNEQVASVATPRINNDETEMYDDQYPDIGEFVSKFYFDHAHCRDLYGGQQSSSEQTITEADYLPENIEVMTPILDGIRRLDSDAESAPDRKYSTDTTSTETFHENYTERRKIEEENLASLRNLSTNGLNMFDPLVINAVTENDNRQLPDNDLVTSLNEQVTEIADRLSSIVASTNEERVNEDLDRHSFSTNDVPLLVATDDFAINEPLNCLPSTSHGYLIPNAISQEPVVLASLSHNNSAVFNNDEEEESIVPDNVSVNANISIANANLSSLLLTNGEYRNRIEEEENKVQFALGYESEQESPADSGVSTENTSLDRSPDAETNKEHFMEQNRVLKSPVGDEDKTENVLENSFSERNGDVTLNINYEENEQSKNEASSSNRINAIERDRVSDSEEDVKEERRRVLQEWGANASEEEYRTIGEVITELRRNREADKALLEQEESRREASSSRQKKKKSSKKKRKMWSPGRVILDNRTQSQSPLRLDLDRFVDESATLPECADDEEIAIALQAQELAARQQARGKFKSSEDLIHRLFVCIAGVADQLQTNFAADLRNILKSVFLMNQTPEKPETPEPEEENEKETIEYEATEDQVIQNGSSVDSVYSAEEVYADSNSSNSDHSNCDSNNSTTVDSTNINSTNVNSTNVEETSSSRLVRRNTLNASVEQAERRSDERRKSMDGNASTTAAPCVERAPEWVPDMAAPACMRCSAHFTAFRRRHHCRNCGKVFCASCSSNSLPLPRFGQLKPVRVCDECFGLVARRARPAPA